MFLHQQSLLLKPSISRYLAFLFMFGLVACNHESTAKFRVMDEVMDKQALSAKAHSVIKKFLQQPVELKVGPKQWMTTYQELGFRVDEVSFQAKIQNLAPAQGLKDEILQKFKGGDTSEVIIALPVEVDVAKATEFLTGLKKQVDVAATKFRIHSGNNTVIPGEPGYLLQVLDSVVNLQYEARRLSGGGKTQPIALAGIETPPLGQNFALTKNDFSVVLGWWKTHYPTGAQDSNRTGNLKLGAEKLDQKILWPGEFFSFNDTVGERTEEAGFRVAPEIGGGEIVEGVGGGMCQLSSTLHAASFFAGLDILETTPHSRPSTYIPPGLDSTVDYPKGKGKGKDLKMRNPFNFPVMIRYSVGEGRVLVTVLGRERPFKVQFHREVLSIIPYGIAPVRLDPKMPMNQEPVLDQAGHVGYKIRRTRCYIYPDKPDPVCPPKGDTKNKDTWYINYEPVFTIERKGMGPVDLKPIPKPNPHYVTGIKDPEIPLVITY